MLLSQGKWWLMKTEKKQPTNEPEPSANDSQLGRLPCISLHCFACWRIFHYEYRAPAAATAFKWCLAMLDPGGTPQFQPGPPARCWGTSSPGAVAAAGGRSKHGSALAWQGNNPIAGAGVVRGKHWWKHSYWSYTSPKLLPNLQVMISNTAAIYITGKTPCSVASHNIIPCLLIPGRAVAHVRAPWETLPTQHFLKNSSPSIICAQLSRFLLAKNKSTIQDQCVVSGIC